MKMTVCVKMKFILFKVLIMRFVQAYKSIMSGTTSNPALHTSSRQPGKSLGLFFIVRTPYAKKIKADSGKKCSR